MFVNGRGLLGVFSRALVLVPESIAYITCNTQVTLKFETTRCWLTIDGFFLMYVSLSLDLITDKNRWNDCVGLQLLADIITMS